MKRRLVAPCVVWIAALAASLAMHRAAPAAEGWTTDYTVREVSGMYETPPASATAVAWGTTRVKKLTMPFSFPYWGVWYDEVWVTLTGYCQFGVTQGYKQASNGQIHTVQAGDEYDGLCAPHWANFSAGGTGATAYEWVAGSAPNRRYIVSWEDFYYSTTSGEHRYFQVQYYEGSGRIVFAYRPDTTPSTWVGGDYSVGMVAPGADPRWIVPQTDSTAQRGHPTADFEFTPRTITVSGRVLWDRPVPDATGVPATPVTDIPLAGTPVELRYQTGTAAGTVNGRASTAADGTYTFTSFAGHAVLAPEIHVVARCDAAEVRAPGGAAPLSFRIFQGGDFAADLDAGTRRINATNDAAGAFRAPLAISDAIRGAHAWASGETTTTIPPVVVRYHATGSTATSWDYSVRELNVAGPQAANPDMWDAPVVVRTWARHLLATLTSQPQGTADDRFDAVTSADNAFAVAFCHYVQAAVSGGTTFIDSTSASSSVVIGLEAPSFTSAPGIANAASMTSVLFDLLDAANETADEVDGTAGAGDVLRIADGFVSSPTAHPFLDAWASAGLDAVAITRIYVAAGLLPDDSLEPNDRVGEAAPLGATGVLRTRLVLNRHQTDWFSVTLPAAAPALVADVKDDGSTSGVGVELEIRSSAGVLLATGSVRPSTGALHAQTGAVAPGTYLLSVRHVSGAPYASYGVQALVPVEIPDEPLRDWTLGRPYDFPVTVRHGIPPYSIATLDAAPAPPGLVLQSDGLRVKGTPLATGEFGVSVQASDSGSPVNFATRSVTVRIHDELRIALPEFVCFPAGRAVATTLPATGGTPPLVFVTTGGALPAGLAFDPGTLRVTGTAAVPGSTDLSIGGTDVAGSADHADVTAVVAVEARGKGVPATLAAGPSACGWWFDAVEGSVVSVSVTTAKKNPKRALSGVILGPDRAVVAPGAVRSRTGSVSASKVVCPASGRYYVVVSSGDAGAAASLLATISAVPLKKGKASLPDFAPDDTHDLRIGALPGSTLVLRLTGDKKSGLVARLAGIRAPDGTVVPHGGLLREDALGGTLTLTLPAGGTWTFVLGARSTSGQAGKLSWTASVRAPKGATWVAE